jgi:hypothetical protein
MLGDVDLTDSERTLCAALAAGTSVDFRRPGKTELEDVASGAAWGPERTVRALALIDFLTQQRRPGETQPRALRVAGARVVGNLDLQAAVLLRPLVLEACFFDEPVRLDECQAPRVELSSCCMPGLSARQLETRGDFVLDGLMSARGIVLTGARIGGMFALRYARLATTDDIALDGSQLEVREGIDCTHLQASGQVRLLGAHIGGELHFDGARLSHENGYALHAPDLRVDQSLLCKVSDAGQRFEATGGVSLIGSARRRPGEFFGGQVD